MAAVKRGAGPNSPMLTADVSSVSTQPAPIRRSACSEDVGKATTCSRFTLRRISARVAAMATPETSRGTASMQPSVMPRSASSSGRIAMIILAAATREHSGLVWAPTSAPPRHSRKAAKPADSRGQPLQSGPAVIPTGKQGREE